MNYLMILNSLFKMIYHSISPCFINPTENSIITMELTPNIYHINDYFPLSAISEAKGILKSQKTWHHWSVSLKKKKRKLLINKNG